MFFYIVDRMCEWLSFGEWCDVQLLCGGHSFSAHRAVLASVSNFLRRILLSTPDETTTFIVLPDFDLEAMTSVLYYIYNGEVVLQKNKLGLFLEIIQAMQIYIDCQYLPKIQEDVEDKYCEFIKHCETVSLYSEIFTLGFTEDKDQHIFNIKRCKESQQTFMKYSQRDLDFYDNSVRCQNESEPRLGNLNSPYQGRQRNSLLRDLYIEAYPRNGNVNGLTESVLAISNECYQSPASVLLANANCNHLSIDDAYTRQSKKASCHSLHPFALAVEDGLQRTNNFNMEYGEIPTCDTTNSLRNRFTMNASIYDKSDTFLDVNRFIPIERNQKLSSTLSEKNNHTPCDVSKLVLNPMDYQVNKNADNRMLESSLAKYQSIRKKIDMKSKNSTKVIFNHVLENPWNARKPNNYKPFRRKEKYADSLPVYKEEKNDTNNNIQNSKLVPEENEEKVVITEQELVEGPSIMENRESFKCTQCDQVFTSDKCLAVHMKRHSSTARYTCGECGKTFSQLRNFKYHMSIHRGTREFAASCTVCGKYFNDRGYLSSHMKIHRNRKEYKCSLCPKSFNQRVAYNMHVRIHTGVKPHVCDECGKAFSRKMLLKQHQRTHSGERPYACPHCDKRFADRSNMTLHLRLHTGVKPFSCPMCPKSFTKKHHLKSHLNFHTGSKPYSCPRCGLAFTQSSNMRTHYKKCTAPEPSASNQTELA